ncbi:MAG: heavy metal sensor histidine kinase [Pyrinomonadaceae bacterium]
MFDSIRTQLMLWFTGVLAVVLIVFAIAAYLFLGYTIRLQTDKTLQEISRTLIGGIEREQADSEGEKELTERRNLAAIQEALDNLRFRNYQIFVFDTRGKLLAADNQTPAENDLTDGQATELAADFSNSTSESAFFTLTVKESKFRVFAKKKFDGQNFGVIIAHPLDDEDELLDGFRNILFIFVPLVLILAGFGGYFLARKTLSPVAQMSATASNISATNLHARLPVKNKKDELGGLATVFNSLLARLDESFERQKRFMADASHELRTPLAIVRGEAEVALSKEDRPNRELRESLSIVQDEGKRLTRIVEDIFTLARVDSGQLQANFNEIYLDELLADCVRKVRVLAEKRNISLEMRAAEELPMRGDEQLLQRLFVNLLDNAIKYNRSGGSVSIEAKKSAGKCLVTITDTGAGIPKDEQAKIFERFYRADKARSRTSETTTSGAGLGLSIAGWIAEVHRAEIELVCSDDKGSVFRVIFSI